MPYTKDYHATPFGQSGGLSTYPVAGVVSGAELSIDTAPTVDGIDNGDPSLAAVSVAAGVLRFNGKPVSFTGFTGTVQSDVADLGAEDTVVDVYLSPTRVVPVFYGAPPAPGGFNEGDFAAGANLNTDLVGGQYGVVYQIYVIEQGAWAPIRAFEGSHYPREYGWNNMPYNEIDATAAPLVGNPELPVFLGSKLPPHTARPLALFRQTCSIKIGSIAYVGGVASLAEGIPDEYLLPV